MPRNSQPSSRFVTFILTANIYCYTLGGLARPLQAQTPPEKPANQVVKLVAYDFNDQANKVRQYIATLELR